MHDLDALGDEHGIRFGGGDRRDRLPHNGHRVSERRTAAGGFDQRLGRDAAGEGAVPTERAGLDQHDAGAAPGRGAGGGEPARAPADHQQVRRSILGRGAGHAKGTRRDRTCFHRRERGRNVVLVPPGSPIGLE